ncbi:MAG: HipA N-terminal domain-containing protein [Anaerolineales bacterium]
MDEEITSAEVYYRDKKAGILTKTQEGYEFIYDGEYLGDPTARQISFSMPLRSEKYESDSLFSFFDGLLPEGWLLDLISATAKIDKNNKFRLLLHTGRDPIGAVSVRPVGGTGR